MSDVGPILRQAQQTLRDGHPAEAWKLVAPIVKADPSNAAAWRVLAEISQEKAPEKSQEYREKAERLETEQRLAAPPPRAVASFPPLPFPSRAAETPGTPESAISSHADTVLAAADQAFRDGRWADVYHFAALVLRDEPQNERALLLLRALPPHAANPQSAPAGLAAPERRRTKPIIISLIVALLLIGGAVAAYMLLKDPVLGRGSITRDDVQAAVYQSDLDGVIGNVDTAAGVAGADFAAAVALVRASDGGTGEATVSVFSTADGARAAFETIKPAPTGGSSVAAFPPVEFPGDDGYALLSAKEAAVFYTRCRSVVVLRFSDPRQDFTDYAAALNTRLEPLVCP